MSKDQKDLVFVISAGRTGTQFLGDRLSTAIPGSFSVHEPDILPFSTERLGPRIKTFGLWHMTVGKALGRSGARAIGQKLLAGRIGRPEAIKRLRQSRERYHASRPEPLIIESNLQWHFVCDELSLAWPQARIVLISRDPRTWIRSWLNKGTRWTWYDPVRLLPPGRLTPADIGDSRWAERWRSIGVLGRLAWEWQFIYGRLLRHAGENRNARMFRFEDLFFSRDDRALRELLEFTATHPTRRYDFEVPPDFLSNVDNASTGDSPSWHAWTPEQARLVHELCGRYMSDLGYGQEASWQNKLAE